MSLKIAFHRRASVGLLGSGFLVDTFRSRGFGRGRNGSCSRSRAFRLDIVPGKDVTTLSLSGDADVDVTLVEVCEDLSDSGAGVSTNVGR